MHQSHHLELVTCGENKRRACIRSAQAIEKNADDARSLIEEAGGLDPTVAEVAGLAHDLGHPPFGHIAEHELDQLLQVHGVREGFNGNAQSFRAVTKLIIWDQSFRGLNLTRASLNAILKYPWLREASGKKYNKWGAYHSEVDDFEFARLGSSNSTSLEAEIMDLADDITYSIHDLFDFYRAGLIPLPLLTVSPGERKEFLGEALIGSKNTFAGMPIEEASQRLANILDLLNMTEMYLGRRSQDVRIRFATDILVRHFVSLVDLKRDTDSRPAITFPELARADLELLKALNWHYVIQGRTLTTQQNAKSRIIKFLFKVNLEACMSGNWKAVLPLRRREQLSDIMAAAVLDGENSKVAAARIVADYISSLTDSEAILMFRRLQGIDLGRVTDWLPG